MIRHIPWPSRPHKYFWDWLSPLLPLRVLFFLGLIMAETFTLIANLHQVLLGSELGVDQSWCEAHA